MVVVGQLGRAPDALERIAQPRARRARRRRRRAAARRLRRALRALADDVARGEAERAVGDVAREVRLREEPLLQVRHVARVRELDGLLHGMGYSSLLRSPVENATLFASRLPVRSSTALTLDESPVASVNGKEVWVESRGAQN